MTVLGYIHEENNYSLEENPTFLTEPKRMTCDIVESTSCLHSVTNILKRLPKSSVNPIFDLATPLPLKWARKRTIVEGCRVPSAPLLQT